MDGGSDLRLWVAQSPLLKTSLCWAQTYGLTYTGGVQGERNTLSGAPWGRAQGSGLGKRYSFP